MLIHLIPLALGLSLLLVEALDGHQFQHVDLVVPEDVYIEEIPGVALSPNQERLYVFNRGHHPLLAFDRDGQLLDEIGEGLFETPHGLRVDVQGNIWTTDTGNHLVLKFSPEGEVLMVLGKRDTASAGWLDRDYNHVFLNRPSDVAFDHEGNIYVADGGNFRVVVFSAEGDFIRTFGEQGNEAGQFNFPHSILIDNNARLLVGDRENQRIQVFDLDGNYRTEWTEIGYPYGLSSGSNFSIWMTDARSDQLVHLSGSGEVLARYGQPGHGLGQYRFLHGLAPSDHGIYLSDILNWKVEFLSWDQF